MFSAWLQLSPAEAGKGCEASSCFLSLPLAPLLSPAFPLAQGQSSPGTGDWILDPPLLTVSLLTIYGLSPHLLSLASSGIGGNSINIQAAASVSPSSKF